MEATRKALRATARLYQRIGARIIVGLAFMGVLWCQIYFLLNSGFAARLFDESVNQLFRGRIVWSRITWGPLPWTLAVLEPQLIGPDGQPVVSVDAIYINELDLPGLLAGRIHAEAIVIERPRVRLIQRVHPTALDEWGEPEVAFNIEELFWPPDRLADDGEPGRPPDLDFRRAEIIGGSVVIDMQPFSLRARGLNIADAEFSLIDGRLGMRAEQFSLRRGVMRVPAGGELTERVADAPRADVLSWRIVGLEGGLYRWDDRWFGVERLSAQVDGDALSIRGFGMNLDTLGLPEISASAHLRTADISRALRQLGLAELAQGPLEVRVSAKGEMDSLDGRAVIEGGPLTVADQAVPGLRAVVDVEGLHRFIVREAAARLYGGRVTATGDVTLDGEATATVQVADLDPVALPVVWPDSARRLLAGAAKVGVQARATGLFGEGREASAALQLDLRRRGGAAFGVGPRVRLDAIAAWDGQTARLHSADLDAGTAQLSASGTVDTAALTASLRWSGRAPSVAPFLASVGESAEGRLTASGSLGGALRAPRITARVEGRALGVRGLSLGDLSTTATVDLAGERLTVDTLDLKGPLGRVAGSGRLGLAGRQPLSARLDVRGVDVSALPLDLPIGGRVDARVTVGGRLSRPTVDGTARVVRPRYDGLSFHRLDVDGAWDNAQVRVRRLALADEAGERLTVEGSFTPRTGAFDGRVALTGVDLALVNRFLAEPIPLRGRISADLGGAGRLSDPRGSGDIQLTDIGYGDLTLGDGTLRVTAEGQMVTVRGPVFGAFQLDAGIPTGAGPAGRLTVAVGGLDLERFVPAMTSAGVRARVTGEVSAYLTDDFQLDTVHAQLGQLTAGFRLLDTQGEIIRPPGAAPCDPAEPSCASMALSSEEPVRLTYRHADQTVRVGSLRLGGGGQSVEITGEATLDRLALKVAGGLDLGELYPFLRSAFTEVEGAARLAVAVTGPPANPQFSGWVQLQTAELIPRAPTVGTELSLLAPVTLAIQPPIGPVMPGPDGTLPIGLFVVDLPPRAEGVANRFRVRRDDGEVEVTELAGDFVNFRPQSLRVGLRTEEAELDVPRVLNAALRSPDLGFELWIDPTRTPDEQTRLRLTGHIDVLRGEYTADISSAAELTQGVRDNLSGRSRVRQVSVFERSKLLRNLEVDLSLRGQDEIFVRNKVTVLDLDLAVALDLTRVSGGLYSKAETPLSIVGTVDVLDDSRITYARRPFDVTVGDVVFGAGSFLTADVVATYTFRLRTDRAGQAGTFDRGAAGDVREEEVTLTVRVKLDQLGATPEIDLNLSSSSGASKIEVATLVLTGSYPSDLTGAAGASPATEVLLSPVLSLIEAPFEETLDVDLTLTPATTGTLFIDADKLLSRRLRLYSRTPVGDEASSNLQTFGLEYRLNNEVTGELTNEQLGNLNSTSGRLRFRLLLD